MEDLELLPFAKEHIDAVLNIEALCFTDGWSRHTLKAILDDPSSHYFVARCGDQIIAYAGFQQILDEGNIDNVAVRPGFQRKGIARQMVTELLRQAKLLGIAKMMLEVRVSNAAAIALYQAFGFHPVGVRRGYYTKPPEDALLMDYEINREDSHGISDQINEIGSMGAAQTV